MSSQWQSSTMQWELGTFLRAPSPSRSDGAASSAEIGDFVSAAAREGVKAGAERRGPEWSATRRALALMGWRRAVGWSRCPVGPHAAGGRTSSDAEGGVMRSLCPVSMGDCDGMELGPAVLRRARFSH